MPSLTWQEVYERFDPEEPAPPEWHADRAQNPAHWILTALDRPNRRPKVLLTGTTGTGKSTELMRVARARAQKGAEFVVVLDVHKHFWQVVGDATAVERVSSWEVCFLVGMALIRASKERLGIELDTALVRQLSDAWRDLARAALPSTPQIDVMKLARSMTLVASSAVATLNPAAGTAVGVLAELGSSAKWDVPFGSLIAKVRPTSPGSGG